MANPEILKKKILREFTVDALRRIWGLRINDKMFYEVGECFFKDDIYSHLSADEFHLVAWKGYEFITNSQWFTSQ